MNFRELTASAIVWYVRYATKKYKLKNN